jgi:hypothetical protein
MPRKKIKPKLGDVIQIPLPNGMYAYGCIFKDTGLGIYKEISGSSNTPPKAEEYRYVIGFNRGAVESGEWPIVDHRPFPDEESAWPPPTYIKDVISGKYEIYHKGQIYPSTEKRCKGLERTAVWNANHIIDRLMGSDKWN